MCRDTSGSGVVMVLFITHISKLLDSFINGGAHSGYTPALDPGCAWIIQHNVYRMPFTAFIFSSCRGKKRKTPPPLLAARPNVSPASEL